MSLVKSGCKNFRSKINPGVDAEVLETSGQLKLMTFVKKLGVCNLYIVEPACTSFSVSISQQRILTSLLSLNLEPCKQKDHVMYSFFAPNDP